MTRSHRQRTQAVCLASASQFDWDARFAACQRAEDAWRKQADATHDAGLALVESFNRAIAQLKGEVS